MPVPLRFIHLHLRLLSISNNRLPSRAAIRAHSSQLFSRQ
jgi:hypothetical protein